MTLRAIPILAVASFGLGATHFAPQEKSIQPQDVCAHSGPPFVDTCFSVHGRMAAYNGAPSYRIWVIGTPRILGVTQRHGCVVPAAIDSLIGIADQFVFADFVVRPVTPDEPGVMRLVCVSSASHIVTRPAHFLRPPTH